MSDQTTTELSTKHDLQCTLCEKQYASKYSLSQHIESAHKGRRFTCKICKKQFVEFKSLQRHELSLHGENSVSIKCHQCRKLMYSGQISTDPDCQTCTMKRQAMVSRIRSKSVLSWRRKPQPKLNLKCTVCEKQFDNKRTMNTHLLSIHVGRRVKCTICKMSFTQFRDLQRHQLRIHGKDSVTIKCTACIKLLFRGQFDTDCQECVRIRSEKIQFIQRLKKTPKVCEICGVFTVNIAEHRRSHQDTCCYECELCGKGFKTKSSLHQHIKYHSNERPHACDLCDSKFKMPHQLKYHKRCLHSDERPYVCNICHKGFKLCQQLGKHKKIHR